MLVAADVLGLLAAALFVQLAFKTGASSSTKAIELSLFVGTLPGWIVLAKLYRLYEHDQRRFDHSTVDDMAGVVQMMTLGTWGFALVAWVTGLVHPNVPKAATFWLVAIVLVLLGRAAVRAISRRSGRFVQNTVVVGARDVGQMIAKKLLQHPEYGIKLVGFVDADPKPLGPGLEHLGVLGTPAGLPEIVQALDIERVVIAFPNEHHEQTLDLIRSLEEEHVQVEMVPQLFDVLGAGLEIDSVEGVPLLALPPLRMAPSAMLLKRALDIAVSGFALLLLAPLFALIAVAIKLDSSGPVFFRQVRRGAGGGTFRLYKFRTMVADADERKVDVAYLNKHASSGGDPRMFKILNDPRVTRVGRVLRRYFLDELPQLVNVFNGDMSLVGPRPLILEEDEHVSKGWPRKRLDLKPGMTGLWQVLGRSDIAFQEMVRLDYIYVTTWSLWNDIRLLLRTIPLVLRGGGGSY